MILEEFIKGFANQFDETEPSEITAITIFKDLDEWDSLIALSIISFVDEEYNITVTGDDLQKSSKVIDLFEKIKSIKGVKN